METNTDAHSAARSLGQAIGTWVGLSLVLMAAVVILVAAFLIPFFAMVWVDHQLVRPTIGYHPIVSLLLGVFGLCVGGAGLWTAVIWTDDGDPGGD